MQNVNCTVLYLVYAHYISSDIKYNNKPKYIGVSLSLSDSFLQADLLQQ